MAFRVKEHVETVTQALRTARNKGRAMCHVHPCRKRECPQDCPCRFEQKRELRMDTAIAWQAADAIDSLINYLRFDWGNTLKRINNGVFSDRLSETIKNVELFKDITSMHRSNEAHHYLIHVKDMLLTVMRVYNEGLDKEIYWDDTLRSRLQSNRNNFRKVKHLR
jgi:hypothetical protein